MGENKDLKQIIADAIEPKLHEQFIKGCKTGWDAAWLVLQKNINRMTSARQIKDFIKTKLKESPANEEEESK